MGNLAIRDLLWRLSLPHLFDLKGLQKINRRPDSCESLDARAALPQNCSGTKLNAGTYDVNSTDVPEMAHRCAIRIQIQPAEYQGILTDANAGASINAVKVHSRTHQIFPVVLKNLSACGIVVAWNRRLTRRRFLGVHFAVCGIEYLIESFSITPF